jgi:hypothetical protein
LVAISAIEADALLEIHKLDMNERRDRREYGVAYSGKLGKQLPRISAQGRVGK